MPAVVRGAQGLRVLDVGQGHADRALLPQDQQGRRHARHDGLRVRLQGLPAPRGQRSVLAGCDWMLLQLPKVGGREEPNIVFSIGAGCSCGALAVDLLPQDEQGRRHAQHDRLHVRLQGIPAAQGQRPVVARCDWMLLPVPEVRGQEEPDIRSI